MSELPDFGLGYPGTDLRRRLVAAVLAGEKTATAGLGDEEERSQLGDRFALYDEDERVVGVVEVTEARVIPAREIDLEFARDEGEGFESVEDWRVAHENFFERPIDGDTPIVAVRFRLVERRVPDLGGNLPVSPEPPSPGPLTRTRRSAAASRPLRVWIDMTASAHVLVFRPLIELLRRRGDEVEVTAREYAQTLQLLELHGIEAEVIGRHGGRSRLGKARQLWSRLHALRRWARGRRFDVALAHGSHELTLTAHRLGIPSSTTFDYEFAWLQHQLGCRAATRVVVPETIPPDRLARYGAVPPKLLQYPGLKEEYYLADFECDPHVLDPWPIDPARVLVVLRPPPDVSLYHRHSNPLFPRTLDALGRDEGVHAVVLPRTEEQREFVRSLDLPSVILPERAVDAQSLIALADLVVSAGGTMNREAAALGVPVYTTYGGRLGGVDETLIREGRLVPLTDPRALDLRKRVAGGDGRVRRDPAQLLGLLLSAYAAESTASTSEP